MKNDSPFYRFPTMDDKFFDKNKDGKLTGTETIFRDAHLMEMSDKVDAEINKQQPTYSRKRSSSGVNSFTIIMFILFILFLIDMLSK